METLLKISGVLAVLIVPIILSILNNRLAHLKHSNESRAEALKLAEEFDTQNLEKHSNLYKDRFAKSLFGNDELTYSEAKFFSMYENADIWIKEYVKIRGMLQRERNDIGTSLTGFKLKSSWFKVVLGFIGYIVFASFGLIPFVIMNKYIEWMVISYEKGVLLTPFLLIILPMMFLVVAYLCLKYIERSIASRIFLHDFYNQAFKVQDFERQSQSSEDNYTAKL